ARAGGRARVDGPVPVAVVARAAVTGLAGGRRRGRHRRALPGAAPSGGGGGAGGRRELGRGAGDDDDHRARRRLASPGGRADRAGRGAGLSHRGAARRPRAGRDRLARHPPRPGAGDRGADDAAAPLRRLRRRLPAAERPRRRRPHGGTPAPRGRAETGRQRARDVPAHPHHGRPGNPRRPLGHAARPGRGRPGRAGAAARRAQPRRRPRRPRRAARPGGRARHRAPGTQDAVARDRARRGGGELRPRRRRGAVQRGAARGRARGRADRQQPRRRDPGGGRRPRPRLRPGPAAARPVRGARLHPRHHASPAQRRRRRPLRRRRHPGHPLVAAMTGDIEQVARRYARYTAIGAVVIAAAWHVGYDLTVTVTGWQDFRWPALAAVAWVVHTAVGAVAAVALLRGAEPPRTALLAAVALAVTVMVILACRPADLLGTIDWGWGSVGWIGVMLLWHRPRRRAELIGFLAANAGIMLAAMAVTGAFDRVSVAKYLVVVAGSVTLQLGYSVGCHALRASAQDATLLARRLAADDAWRMSAQRIHADRLRRYAAI